MTRKHVAVGGLLVLLVFVAGCRTAPSGGITQVATIDALLSGVYDGHMSLETLRTYGDFGIGTFEALDGEMVLLDGTFYQIRADGHVYRPALSERTPFACVTTLSPDVVEAIEAPTDMNGLEARIHALVPQPNRFCAFRVHGEFSRMRTRSVPAQQKPYPPLAAITRTQPVFDLEHVRGTLVGFRAPAFVKGVNVPGYHLHFLADDRQSGGHVLGFDMTRGTLQADTVHEWLHLFLPTDSAAFGGADLAQDRTADLKAVEKERRKEP